MLSENEKITGTFINEILINKYIDGTIKAWATSKKANIDNVININHANYSENNIFFKFLINSFILILKKMNSFKNLVF